MALGAHQAQTLLGRGWEVCNPSWVQAINTITPDRDLTLQMHGCVCGMDVEHRHTRDTRVACLRVRWVRRAPLKEK